MKIPDGLWSKIEEVVLEQARENLPGEVKLKAAIHSCAVWLAKQTKGVPDAIEIPVYQTMLWFPVQWAYDRLKADGKL